MSINLKKTVVMSVIPLTLLLNSCGSDFSSVRSFSDMVVEINKSALNIANGVYDSCRRRAQYDNANFNQFIEQRDALEQKCERPDGPKESSADLNKAYAVLTTYMGKLGELAGANAVPLNRSLDNIEGSLNNLTEKEHTDTIGAGIAIAKFLSNVWNQKTRYSNLKKAIVCTNQPVQTYIHGLIQVTQKVYITGTLDIEKQQIREYYVKFTPRAGVEPSTLFEIEQSYNKAMSELNRRKEEAQTFIEILEETAQYHEELAQEFYSEAKNVTCEDYANEDTTQKFYQATPEDPKQIKRVSDILTNYAKTIKPKLKKLNKDF